MNGSTLSRLHICCIIPALRAGGAERVMAGLCNHLVVASHKVTLITLAHPSEPPFYSLDARIEYVALDQLRPGNRLAYLISVIGRVFPLRRAIRERTPDVVLSFLDTMNITTLIATRGLDIPVVVSERIDPAAHRPRIGRCKSALRRLTYPWAERVVVQTRRAENFFSFLPATSLCILPNPVSRPERKATPDRQTKDGTFHIIAVGRLDPQKGFDLLIEAFSAIANTFPEWDLHIFGEGPQRANLETQASRHGLSDRIHLVGITPDIEAVYRGAHLLACPSRYEGFPNALAEAMAAGLPAIAFEGVSGVEDLVENGRNGILVPYGDIGALAKALAKPMSDPGLRIRLGTEARRQTARFTPEDIHARWNALLAETAGIMQQRAPS